MLTMAPRLYKSLFSPPPAQPSVPMPDPDSPEALAARRKQLIAATSRSGRASTQLSGDYAGSTLGTK